MIIETNDYSNFSGKKMSDGTELPGSCPLLRLIFSASHESQTKATDLL